MDLSASKVVSKKPVGGVVHRSVEAARALAALLRDPDDTRQVFRMFETVQARPSAALLQRFARTRGGERLLAERPDILEALRDRPRLRALPEGSLGRAYLAFMESDNLTADWLVQASGRAGEADSDPGDYFSRRMRDTHDLWHVVTGYRGDLVGEGAVLAFTYAQTFAPGIGILASMAAVVSKDPDVRRLLLDAVGRGLTAAWLPAVEWEKLLDRPLEEVRADLRLGAPRRYEPFFAKDLPPGGLLALARAA